MGWLYTEPSESDLYFHIEVSTRLVVPMRAPQSEILNHPPEVDIYHILVGTQPSLDSIVKGVAMIAWPLCDAEQGMNGSLLTEDIRSCCHR